MTHPANGDVYRATLAASVIALSTLIAGGLAGCQSSQSATESGARMYDGYGGYARDISTASPRAQKWFNQGIQLLYGYNHDEAIRSFREATNHDPNCVMAWWGISYASGLHINNPVMTEAQSKQGYEAAQAGLAVVEHGSPVEQALMRAVAERYEWPVPADRKPLDQAYANAMERVWNAFPDDPDVGSLFAESLMNLQPWDYWTKEGEPKGRALDIVGAIERVLASHPKHPGANHFYIHAVEASNDPHRAIPAADLLSNLVPGSGHLVHMPAHIYARVERYAEASDVNERAIKVDRAYFKLAPKPDFYSMYFVHNIHFLSWSAMMEGRYATALKAAQDLEKDIPAEFLRDWTYVADGFMPVTYHVMVRFGKWDEILSMPEPPQFRLVSRSIHHYARGVALSALGRVDEAKAEQAKFEAVATSIPENWQVGQNKAHSVMAIARRMLAGEIAYREGNHEDSFATLREAATLEDNLVYDEPPGWMQPVRHALGALMMGANRGAEAEQVYRVDLQRNPGNGWGLLGLEKALQAQGKTTEAAATAARRAAIWTRTDVNPTSSCYCEPGA